MAALLAPAPALKPTSLKVALRRTHPTDGVTHLSSQPETALRFEQ
mgnify:FL=1